MPDRIDDLFELEKLRRSWARQEESPEERASGRKRPDLEETDALKLFPQLMEYVGERYTQEESEGLAVLLDTLKDLLLKRFDPPEKDEMSEEEKVSLDSIILKTLSDIETVIDALEQGKSGSRSLSGKIAGTRG